MVDFIPADDLSASQADQEQEDYVLLGKDRATLIVQPGFVEGIVPEKRRIAAISDAYRFIFRNNREYGILLWNGIPVRFSYTEDLPLMVEPLVQLLGRTTPNGTMNWTTPNFALSWELEKTADGQLRIRQQCDRIKGGYERALNQLGMIILPEKTFLNEWKLLLNQLVEAFDRSEVQLDSGAAKKLLEQLRSLNETITGPGALYRYGKE